MLQPIGATSTLLAGIEPITGKLAPGTNANGSDVTHYGDPSAWWVSGNLVAVPLRHRRLSILIA